MANIELDTTKTQNIASKFNDKINVYNNTMTNFFTKLCSVGGADGAWTGNDSVIFTNRVLEEKRIYEDFSVLLSEFVKTIDESCDEIATAVSRSRIN
jgi:hypothetical protein